MNQQNENMMNLKPLCDKLIAGSRIDPQLYEKFHVKYTVMWSTKGRSTPFPAS